MQVVAGPGPMLTREPPVVVAEAAGMETHA
jgi:hypothetical protein